MILRLLGIGKPYKYNIAICCIVKDETPYLDEWISYHIKIGVEHFFIYDNESKIPVENTVSRFVEKGIVTVSLISGTVQQMNAYQHCIKNNRNKARWIAFIDADEFIVPKNPTGNLSEFLIGYRRYGGMGINWLVFGSNNHKEKQISQIKSYTRRSLKSHSQNRHYKTIVQTKYVKKTANAHRFRYIVGKYCVDENFIRIKGDHTKVNSTNKIQLNHYNLRSFEEYKDKMARGRADESELKDFPFFYAVDSYSNIITDEAIIELQMILDYSD